MNAFSFRTVDMLLLWAALVLLAPAVTAADLFDNLDRGPAGSEAVSGDRSLAAAFTSGSAAVRLQSVTLLLARTGPDGSAAVEIRSDEGLEPGALVATLAAPASYSSTPQATTFTTDGVQLQTGATYWVVLGAASGTFEWSWTADSTGSGEGFGTLWDSSDDGGAGWYTHDLYPLQLRVTAEGGETTPRFLRGDCDASGAIDLTDAVFLLLYNFAGGPMPTCLAACDSDGDGQATGAVTDAVYLLMYAFLGGSPPVQPFPACGPGTGPGDEALGCEVSQAGCA
jgi:hypothetical protein